MENKYMVGINPDKFIDLSMNHLTKELQPLIQNSFPSIDIGVTDLKIPDIFPHLKFPILNDSFSLDISQTFNNTLINDFLNQPQPPIPPLFLGINNSGVSLLNLNIPDTILNSSLYKLSDPIQIGKECDRGEQSAPLTFLANLSNEPQQHIQNFCSNVTLPIPDTLISVASIFSKPSVISPSLSCGSNMENMFWELKDDFLNENLGKIISKVKGGDFTGAMTNIYTFFETFLKFILKKNNKNFLHKGGDITPLLVKALKIPHIQGLDEEINNLITPMSETIKKIINNASDRHTASYRLPEAHVNLVKNLVFSICTFLMESEDHE